MEHLFIETSARLNIGSRWSVARAAGNVAGGGGRLTRELTCCMLRHGGSGDLLRPIDLHSGSPRGDIEGVAANLTGKALGQPMR